MTFGLPSFPTDFVGGRAPRCLLPHIYPSALPHLPAPQCGSKRTSPKPRISLVDRADLDGRHRSRRCRHGPIFLSISSPTCCDRGSGSSSRSSAIAEIGATLAGGHESMNDGTTRSFTLASLLGRRW